MCTLCGHTAVSMTGTWLQLRFLLVRHDAAGWKLTAAPCALCALLLAWRTTTAHTACSMMLRDTKIMPDTTPKLCCSSGYQPHANAISPIPVAARERFPLPLLQITLMVCYRCCLTKADSRIRNSTTQPTQEGRVITPTQQKPTHVIPRDSFGIIPRLARANASIAPKVMTQPGWCAFTSPSHPQLAASAQSAIMMV